MAINPLKVYWLEMLCKQEHFKGKRTILDLGPQDLTTSREIIEKIVSARFQKDPLQSRLNEIFNPDGTPKPLFQKHFYSLFGFEEYYSMDLNDDRADYFFDLNTNIEINRQFDVVTNFGTSEHIFNIGSFYENIHRLMKCDGIALHITPCYADINHGFFNIHPNVYSSLIRANKYRQISFLYLDNYVGRNTHLSKAIDATPDYENLPIQLGNIEDNFGDMHSLKTFRAKVYALLKTNAKSDIGDKTIAEDRGVFDYVFAALQKTSESAFKTPQQYTQQATLKQN